MILDQYDRSALDAIKREYGAVHQPDLLRIHEADGMAVFAYGRDVIIVRADGACEFVGTASKRADRHARKPRIAPILAGAAVVGLVACGIVAYMRACDVLDCPAIDEIAPEDVVSEFGWWSR